MINKLSYFNNKWCITGRFCR